MVTSCPARRSKERCTEQGSSVNPLTAEWALRALIDFALSNARRFYSPMGNPLAGKGLTGVRHGDISCNLSSNCAVTDAA